MFDTISKDDLIMAFFPCIYFTGFTNPRYFTLENNNYKGLTTQQKFDAMIERADNRNNFYKLLYKLVGIVIIRSFRMVVENPFSQTHYLHNNFLFEPTVVDKDRTRRGDYFTKPTGFWYFNCEPTYGFTYQRPKKHLRIMESKSGEEAGICSEERSMISPDYAHNFICDFILGKPQKFTQLTIWD